MAQKRKVSIISTLIAVIMIMTACGNFGKEEKDFSLGRIEGSTYINDYWGIACNMGAGWKYSMAEELQDFPEKVVAEAIQGTALEDYMAQNEYVIDIYAENSDKLSYIDIVYQKLSAQQIEENASISDEEIIENLHSNSKLMADVLSRTGILVDSMSTKKVTFAGEERIAFYIKGKISSIDYYILQIQDYSLGEYAAAITFGSSSEKNIEAMLSSFYTL